MKVNIDSLLLQLCDCLLHWIWLIYQIYPQKNTERNKSVIITEVKHAKSRCRKLYTVCDFGTEVFWRMLFNYIFIKLSLKDTICKNIFYKITILPELSKTDKYNQILWHVKKYVNINYTDTKNYLKLVLISDVRYA